MNDPKAPQLDDVSSLNQLGSQQTVYQYDAPDASHLESFPNLAEGPKTPTVTLNFEEFTSLCPKTGQPDFAQIVITYVPDKLCVETKSLKLYFFRFRNFGAFMETIVGKIRDDLVTLLAPKKLVVTGQFNARGGVTLTVTADYDIERENIMSRMDDMIRSMDEAVKRRQRPRPDHAPDLSGTDDAAGDN